MADIWNAVSAISAAIGAAVVVLAAIYAKGQVAEARRSREISLLLNIHERYHDKELVSFRLRLFKGEFDEIASLDENEKLLLIRNVDTLETLAIAVNQGLLDFETVHAVFHSSPPAVLAAALKYGVYFELEPIGVTNHLARLVDRYRAASTSLQARQRPAPDAPGSG